MSSCGSYALSDLHTSSSTPPSAPGVTRTPGQRFRKPLLYPPELQGLTRGRRCRKRRNLRELGVVQQGLDAPTLQSLAALQEAQLDQKAESGDRGAGRPDQLRGG